MKPSTVLLRTKLKPVKDPMYYASPRSGRVCAVGALLTEAGYKVKQKDMYSIKLFKDGQEVKPIDFQKIIRQTYGIRSGKVYDKILQKFHETGDLKAVGKYLKELGY